LGQDTENDQRLGTSPEALNQEALELRLEEYVDAVLSSRRTAAGPAGGLAALDRDRQEFVLHWVSALAGSNAEMAFQFAAYAPEALRRMDREGVEAWAIQAMDAFDRQGLMSGVAALKSVEVFVRGRKERLTGLSLDDVAGVLENFVHGLSGRRLKIEAADRAGTDTETLFLPGLLSLMPRREDNFRLYKSIAVHLWAQTRYGTWRIRPQDRVLAFPDPDRALRVYHALEVIRLDQHIAVMFMVDMSGSTKGWINDAERESLLLLCEVLETLGDRYAIYGFSGMNRTRCELFRVKRFDESYSELVRARISGIRPQDYTRMGVVIRHLTMLLGEVEARTKLLITLSDGKPDDYIGYRGKYGIEDTRQALFEARREGIHPFCITIDEQAGDYLPHMYGQVNYVVIDDVRKLPLKVSDIYRQLTA